MTFSSSIRSNLSPLRFSAHKLNRFNRSGAAKNAHARQINPDNNHPGLTISPQKIAENRILNGIENILGADKSASAPLNPAEFDAQQLADKIFDNIKQNYNRLQNGDPDFDQAEFFSRIRDGLETGFGEAREALNELGLLERPLKNRLDEAYDKIQKKLSTLEPAGKPSPAAITGLQGVSAQRKESSTIEIVTQEGDVVRISLAQTAANRQSAANLEQDGLVAEARQSLSETGGGFSITVEGDLNEDEKRSLQQLLKDMDSVRHEFFDGNFQAAFDHARQIGFDGNQIAGFSLSLSLEKSVKAVAAYRRIGSPDQQIEPDKLKQSADFFSRAREILTSAESILQPFANLVTVFTVLFNAVTQVGAGHNRDADSSQPHSALPQLAKPLAESILTDSNTPHG